VLRSLAAGRAWFLVVTLTAVGLAGAAGYGLTAPKRYQATAQLLVSPVSASDPAFAGLDVLRDASGKRTAAASAAVLVRSPQVADAVRAQLGVRRSSEALLREVDAHVVGSSDVVAVGVDDTSAASAAQLANAFVDALVAQRTSSFQSQLASAIHRDAELLATAPAGSQSAELARRLALLRSFQGQPDPTLRRAATATAPASSYWPKLWAFLLAGGGIGLAIGALLSLTLALLRRGRVDALPEYSRGMSERAVQALVERLEKRLAARESALVARERDLQAKIDELRSLEAQRRAAAPPADGAVAPEVSRREGELDERERALVERVAAVTRRELAVARAAAQAARPPAPAARTAPTGPVPVPDPPPVPRREAVSGAFTLDALERLVAAGGAAHPERRDEWESTLFFLREYAEPDGRLPASFDWLVQDTFAPLL
jgi:capsular polysaccharide biosynthesis protein